MCKLKTQLSSTQSSVKKQVKPMILTVRSTFLRRIGSAFLDSVWVQDTDPRGLVVWIMVSGVVKTLSLAL